MEGTQTLSNTPGMGEPSLPTDSKNGSGDMFDATTKKKKKKRECLIYTPLDKFLENIQPHVYII